MWMTPLALSLCAAAAGPPSVGAPPPLPGPAAAWAPPPPGTMLECGIADGEVPAFQLEDVSPGSPTHGQQVDRPPFPGGALMLYFALPTCGHCQAQVQQLQTLWDAHGERWGDDFTLQIVALAAGESGLPDLTQGLTLPVLQDTPEAAVQDRYGAEKWYVYLIDRDGRVRHIHYKFDLTNHADRLLAEIDQLIAEGAR